MVRKIKAKAILRLNDQGLSGRAIARSLGIARQSVAEVLAASAAAGIAYPDVETKPDDEVYSMLFPGRGERESVYEQPDWARVHRELARVGVTLRILHGEYADECAAAGRPRMGYDRFCKQYAGLCGEDRCDEQGRAQGRTHHRGRLGRQDHADRRSGHRSTFRRRTCS